MTLDRTPPNAPVVPAHKPGQCSAWGCPMWAGIKVGTDWVCDCHAFADMAEWQEVTARLNQRRWLVRAIHRAMHLDAFASKGWHSIAASFMTKHGRPDLAPRQVVLAHPYRDRHTGEVVDRSIERDETQHLALWAARLRSTLFRECVNGIPQPQQPGTTKPDDTWKKGGDMLGGFAA